MIMSLLMRRREACGLTRQDVAHAIGCAVDTLRKIETGALRPSLLLAERLAETLDIVPDEYRAFIHHIRWREPLVPPLTKVYRPPTLLHPCIGRDQERHHISQLLSDGVRLLTLTGPPGVGKTCLALAVAADSLTLFHHGVLWVDLAVVKDATTVPNALAQALGCEPSAIVASLQSHHLLIICDNGEHLAAAAPFLLDLLTSCSQVVVMLTSRERWHMYGENTYAVAPLPVPSLSSTLSPDEIVRVPSVALLLARAQAVRHTITVTPAEIPPLVQLCQVLDGLPLALELAAAQLRYHTLEHVLQHYEQRLDWRSEDVSQQYTTLRASIDWSIALLTTPHQGYFAALGVCVGPFPRDLLPTLWDIPAEDAHDALLVLLDANLVQWHPETADYSLLHVLQAAAYTLLAASGQQSVYAQRHAEACLRWATTSEQSLQRSFAASTLTVLQRAYANVTAALHGWDERQVWESLAELVSALVRFWLAQGMVTEARTWVEYCRHQEQYLRPELREKLVARAGVLALYAADYPSAINAYRAWIALAPPLLRLTGAWINLGQALLLQQQLGAARAALIQAREYAQGLADDRLWATLESNWGLLLYEEQEYASAATACDAAGKFYRASGDVLGILVTTTNRALIAYRQEKWEVCAQLLLESITLYEDHPIRVGLPEILEVTAVFAYRQGPTQDMAITLLAVADELRSMMQLPLAPMQLSLLEVLIASMHTHAQWENLWKRGSTLTDAEAIALARVGIRVALAAYLYP